MIDPDLQVLSSLSTQVLYSRAARSEWVMKLYYAYKIKKASAELYRCFNR